MKTGTLTFHSPNNNGSFLQAYALQCVLKKNGIENTIINFYTKKQECQYSVFRKPKSLKDLVRNGYSLIHYRALKKRFVFFADLRKKFLNMTERYTTEKEVLDDICQYNVLICGSDQIWNTEARDFSDIYLLPNVKKKKIAYAVSCGSHIEAVNLCKLIMHTKAFDAISVREDSTAKVFFDNGLSDIQTVLDPTLLIAKEEYSCFYGNDPVISGKYVFVYTINYNHDILFAAKQFAKRIGMPVITAFAGYSAIKCRKYGIKVIYDVTPGCFLNLIDNAEYVFSNSFHGIAFSILFHKRFFRVCNVDKCGNSVRDDRIDNILDACNLANRNIKKHAAFKDEPIDYSTVEKHLERLRDYSVKWLLNSLLAN